MSRGVLTERQAILMLERLLGRVRSRDVLIGIGDDAAVLRPRSGRLVWTVDACVEDVHFDRRWLTLEDVGARALHSAASDLAAMGARPMAALSSLVVPAGTSRRNLGALGRGQLAASRELGIPVVGGNISRGRELGITTTVLGTAERVLTRSGARVGDEVWLLGEVGMAAAGLYLLKRGGRGTVHGAGSRAARACIQAWRRPRALLDDGAELVGLATAAIDVSDGLGGDAAQLGGASGVRIVIEESALTETLRPELKRVASAAGASCIDWALAGGEDYALLATGPRKRRPAGARPIGRVTRGRGAGLELASGRIRTLGAGFEHLASEA